MAQNKSGYLLRPTGILRIVLIYEHVMAVHGKRFGIPKTSQLGKTLLRGSVLPRGYLTKSLSVGIHRLAVRPDRHSNRRCAESWQRFSDKVDAMPFVKQRRMRPLFAFAARCEADAQGRILLPQNLRDYAGLTKDVTIVGCNNHAELWDSARWNEIHDAEMTPENIAAVMEELEF